MCHNTLKLLLLNFSGSFYDYLSLHTQKFDELLNWVCDEKIYICVKIYIMSHIAKVLCNKLYDSVLNCTNWM